MTFTESVKTCFDKYTLIKGRASRSEYWWWFLFCMLVYLFLSVFGIFSLAIGVSPFLVMLLAVLALFGPSFCVTIRRLHDIGKSGWWYWVGAIPLVGPIWLMVLLCSPSQEGENEYDEYSVTLESHLDIEPLEPQSAE